MKVQKPAAKSMSLKGKFASFFLVLCVVSVTILNQNCASINPSNDQRFNFNVNDPNNCGVAGIDLEFMGYDAGRVEVGVDSVTDPVAFITIPLPDVVPVDAQGNIDQIDGATWFVDSSDPSSYQIQIPVASLNGVTYESRTQRLPGEMSTNGTYKNNGPYLFDFDKEYANLKHIEVGIENADAWLYYRDASPQTMAILFTSSGFGVIPSQLRFITPKKAFRKCNRDIGTAALVIAGDEDEDDNYEPQNGIYISLSLDKILY